MINWMRYRLIYFLISAVVILPGLFSLYKWGLKTGIDFTGGTIIEYKFKNEVSGDELKDLVKEYAEPNAVRLSQGNIYELRFSALPSDKSKAITEKVKAKYLDSEELRTETVGATIGVELIKKTFYAIIISASAILLWVAYQFKSIKYGTSAVIAMLHDSLVLLGTFSLLGHFMGAEIDFLFVTAMLTILSFSVHDTIVVYDRTRETQKKYGGDMETIANKALTETMVRSLNNSMTIVFMLIALILLGGETIKWFAVALLVGTISGTYSSPFVAVPILVTWDKLIRRKN
ncbi:MAG: SecF protein [Candidatus Woesebacteria bacterium GW2011_GWA1_37_8]|uniref:Protein-export membrane protein SecF n=2 Tax=Candidatus Woeseibacteriota TaxID=1752722 RepID=A0A0G0PDA9_9BACT|nr:MAG: SecF protein [Microgenomates group bacterium GW2011_GWC1_37_12b]KKQ45961.1 MAG: SecF protein [Candidatus Woesebacteria bacterium GW2011_GWA1_37_8]KKQ87271.1 MAG: SecF protein [Candidatus Woesebacteria bacterium GW2011_GWB1_38_8b]